MSKTITATTKVTKALGTVSATLAKQLAEMEVFTNRLSEVVFEIECKESELAQVEENLETSKRKAVAQLSLAILENKALELKSLLEEQSLIAIAPSELEDLKSQLEAATANTAEKVSTAVTIAVNSATSKAELTAQQVAAEVSVENAQKDASITALTQQLEMSKAQVKELQATIAAEREARVSIAASEASRPAPVVQART